MRRCNLTIDKCLATSSVIVTGVPSANYLLRICDQATSSSEQAATRESDSEAKDLNLNDEDAEAWTLVRRRGKSNNRQDEQARVHSKEIT